MTNELRVAQARYMTEDELLIAIREAAHLMGWRQVHLGGDQRGVYQGDRGFPDLCLARRGVVLFIECKSMTGQLTADQFAWMLELDASRLFAIPVENRSLTGPVTVLLARPTDLDAVIQLLK